MSRNARTSSLARPHARSTPARARHREPSHVAASPVHRVDLVASHPSLRFTGAHHPRTPLT